MASAFFAKTAQTTQYRLKQLCRVIYYSSAIFLVFLYIYVYYGHITSTLEIKRQERKESRGFPHRHPNHHIKCSDNTFQTRDGCLPCPNGTFSFPGWKECKPFLNCSEIALQVHPRKRIPRGIMKEKWLAEWNGHRVVYVNCSRPSAKPQCTRGMTRLEKLQGPYVTRLIGRCYENLKVSGIVFIYLFIYLYFIMV